MFKLNIFMNLITAVDLTKADRTKAIILRLELRAHSTDSGCCNVFLAGGIQRRRYYLIVHVVTESHINVVA